MFFLVAIGVLFAGYGTAYLASEDIRYLTRAGLEETQILTNARPIEELVAKPSTKPATREALRLVLQSRDYAAKLGLEAKETYTTFTDIERDTLLLVLQASPKQCICPYTWKYPIVGRIPYKGFFDFEHARRTAKELEESGHDTYLRPAGAFSTLGWFQDPLLSTALSRDSVELVSTVFHEIAHNTIYVKSATPFNESFAQLVGYRAAEDFFRTLGDTAKAAAAADRWHDEIVLGNFYSALVGRLEPLYASQPDSAALAAGRDSIATWARAELQGPIAAQLKTYRVGRLKERPINNAFLIGARLYRTRLELFDRWYERHGRDVAKSVAALKALVEGTEGDSAYARLQRAIGE